LAPRRQRSDRRGEANGQSLAKEAAEVVVSSSAFGLVELILVFGLLLGFGVWQLYAVRRDQRQADEVAQRREKQGGEPPDG
jgi:hypothetical protein